MLAALAAFASVTAAQEVRTDWDKHAAFERYHTYSWGRVQTSNPLWEARIEEVVDKELTAKGWQKLQDGGDVVVMAVGAAQNQQEYQTNKHLIWRGTSTDALSDNPDRNEKNLDKAVDKMFKKFPPKK